MPVLFLLCRADPDVVRQRIATRETGPSDAELQRQAYNWPGNVRELKDVIQRAVLVCKGDVLLREHLPSRFQKVKGRPLHRGVTFEIGTTLDQMEREMIVRTLAAAKNNRKQTAEILGISRRALYNKLRKHGIK